MMNKLEKLNNSLTALKVNKTKESYDIYLAELQIGFIDRKMNNMLTVKIPKKSTDWYLEDLKKIAEFNRDLNQ